MNPWLSTTLPFCMIGCELIIVTILLVSQLAQFAFAGLSRGVPPSPETFKGLVTFCVAVLNASTVLIIARYFDAGLSNLQSGSRAAEEQ